MSSHNIIAPDNLSVHMPRGHNQYYLFAILKSKEVKTMSTQKGTKEGIVEDFRSYIAKKFNDRRATKFEENYNPTKDEACWSDFDFNTSVFKCFLDPSSMQTLDKKEFEAAIAIGIAHINASTKPNETPDYFISFQVIDSRNILKPEKSYFFANNTLKKHTEPTLNMKKSIDAVCHNGSIYFTSFPLVNRIIDLRGCFEAASDSQILSWLKDEMFTLAGNVDGYCEHFTDKMRRDLNIIMSMNYIEALNVNNLSVFLDKHKELDIQMDGGRIVIPNDRKRISLLLDLLLSKIYPGHLYDDEVLFRAASRTRLQQTST